jgi:hypothetical protein
VKAVLKHYVKRCCIDIYFCWRQEDFNTDIEISWWRFYWIHRDLFGDMKILIEI